MEKKKTSFNTIKGIPYSPEQRRVELNHPHEVEFWTRELAATEAELHEAVRKAGPMVKDVRGYVAVLRRYFDERPTDTGATEQGWV